MQNDLFKTVKAGSIKVGDYCVMNDKPCKVTQINSRVNNRQQTRLEIVGNCLFGDNRKYDIDVYPVSDVRIPYVTL